jgi:iron complex outermembrane receptor protein
LRLLGTMRLRGILGGLLLCELLSLCPTHAVAREMEASSSTRGRDVDEIIVTARRREELIEETPISITAVTEQALRETGITRLNQVQELVPNLTFYSGRSGLTSATFIRGVGQVNSIITFDPGVGIYVDGVFLARAAGSVLNVSDIAQVEVLRGPQGTLFGKNTVGGAINITTVQPTDELEAWAFLRAGSFETVQTRAMLNIPVSAGWLEDKLFTRFSFSSENSGGYTYNAFLDRPGNKNASLAFLGALRFLPTEDIDVVVKGSWFRDHGTSRGAMCVVAVDPAPLAGLIAEPDYQPACRRSEPYRFENDTAAIADIESYGVWGVASWDLGEIGPVEGLVLKSITSWREQLPQIREDGDGTGYRVLQLNDMPGDPPFNGEVGHQQQISQELQIQGSGLEGALNFIGGYFVYWETADNTQAIESLTKAPPSLGGSSLAAVDVDNWSWALFTQATWDPTEWLSLTAGIRYTEEKKGFAKRQVNILTDEIMVDANERSIFTAWTPMASLALRPPERWLEDTPLDHLLGYFTYSQGFKGGGFNGNTRSGVPDQLQAYAPEFLDSYEIGFKSIAWDQRLILNVSLFYGDYSDIQVSTIAPGEGFLAEIVVRNAALATTRGGEFELTALPFEGAQIIGSIGLVDAVYDEFSSVSALDNQEIDRAGEPFNDVPEFQSRLTLQYSFELPLAGPDWLEGWITPRLDWFYRSSVNYQFPELTQAIQGGYNLVHARISYDFNDGRSQFALWGNNLGDQEYFQQVLPTASTLGTIERFYGPPRSFGFEISQRF